jgi:ADP-heptose:LPS heptosyltransferase
MKILIMKNGAIGDVLMTTPFVRQLRKEYPKAQIDYLVGNGAAEVLRGNKDIRQAIVFDSEIFFKKQLGRFFNMVKIIKSINYDMIFTLDKHWVFSLFGKLCDIPNRYGFIRGKEINFLTSGLRYNNEEHEIIQYKNLIQLLHKEPDKNYKMYFKQDKFKLPCKDYICISLGGGNNIGETSCIRRYPLWKFHWICYMLNIPIIFVGGKDDMDLAFSCKNSYNLIGKTTLQETAYIMKNAKLVVCSDSGPMHIASAVNNKIISLFGPTNPKRKAPMNKGAIALWEDYDRYEPEYEFTGKIPKNKSWCSALT